MRVLVVADRMDCETGLVGERLVALGGDLQMTFREDFPAGGPVPGSEADDGADGPELILLLGSPHGVGDPGREDVVAVESALVQDCLARDIPVIAICYGAQLAAHALGGSVEARGCQEIGWYFLESNDPALCPPGPWAQYHYDRFTPPPGSRVLGRSDNATQGFAVETADRRLQLIAWQFHPEVTPTILRRWVGETEEILASQGVDGVAYVREADERAEVARAATYALVDVTLDAMSLVPAIA